MISAVEVMLGKMTNSAAVIGSTNMRIDLQNTFVKDLMDTINKGVGRLVDADMNEESTKLKALQTQEQLGIQSLSIANSESSNILSLFR
jgi:flagellin